MLQQCYNYNIGEKRIADTLGVSELWLMGYDVPVTDNTNSGGQLKNKIVVEKKVATISDRLRVAMVEKECSQSELSRMAGIDRAAISRYLSGSYEPKQDALEKMAYALGVTDKWLSGYDAPKTALTQKTNQIIAAADLRMQDDPDFLAAVELIRSLTPDKLSALVTMLRAWGE